MTMTRSKNCTKNLLPVSLRPVGRLGLVSDDRLGSRMVLDVVVYAVARLLLVVVLTAAIFGIGRLIGITEFPIVVALLFAIVLALPLGIWVFAPLRDRATASMARFDQRRRADREQLRARLRGGAAPAATSDAGAAPAATSDAGAAPAATSDADGPATE